MTSQQQIDLDALRDLAQDFKTHVERQRWPELAGLLAFPAVWVFDRSLPVPEAIGHLRTILDGAVDIHLWMERMLKVEAAATDGHLSINCCLMWGERGNFKDHEVELDLHFGFHREDGRPWSISYFGVTPGTLEEVPFPVDPDRE